jgi:hypothetical protein
MGAGVLATSYVHWRLWDGFGYRHIATIGNLFLAQIITGVIIALLTLFVHRVWTILLCLGFIASVLVGFFLAVTVGIFGFQDSWFAPFAKTAFWLEAATIALSIFNFLVVALRTRRK